MVQDTPDAAGEVIRSVYLCSDGLDLTGIVFTVPVSATFVLNLHCFFFCFLLILEIADTDMMICKWVLYGCMDIHIKQ